MLLSFLLLIPLFGVFVLLIGKQNKATLTNQKRVSLTLSIVNLCISLLVFILFDFSTSQFQFVKEYTQVAPFDFHLGIDGLSIYFVLLTTIITPVSLLSNWKSISKNVEFYVMIILLLETLLLSVFLVLDSLLFYIFFESILPPLFILIGMYGSDNRVMASYYLFLYTLLGSLFLLLSILTMSCLISTTDFDTLFKGNFIYLTQLFIFYGIVIAFAVKTPTIFLNLWLLKAHVESPLGGSIILAAVVLKLSLYGVLRLILPVLPKAYMEYTYIIYVIGVLTIVYASLSTLRTIDVKELIAYSSVSHAAVYVLGVFSNSIQGIEGAISLGLAHGLVSPGLFICAGGVLYDRSHTRLIAFYRGVAQVMPLFAILFFILCLANCGAPLSLNFIGEFLSLYGVFERSPIYGVLASSSIVFSAGYTMYMYQKISFGGSYSRMFEIIIPDVTKREFMLLLTLVVPTVLFGIYPAPILDGIHYSVSTLLYLFDSNAISCEASPIWSPYFIECNTTILLTTYVSYIIFCALVVAGLVLALKKSISILIGWYHILLNKRLMYSVSIQLCLSVFFRFISLALTFIITTAYFVYTAPTISCESGSDFPENPESSSNRAVIIMTVVSVTISFALGLLYEYWYGVVENPNFLPTADTTPVPGQGTGPEANPIPAPAGDPTTDKGPFPVENPNTGRVPSPRAVSMPIRGMITRMQEFVSLLRSLIEMLDRISVDNIEDHRNTIIDYRERLFATRAELFMLQNCPYREIIMPYLTELLNLRESIEGLANRLESYYDLLTPDYGFPLEQ